MASFNQAIVIGHLGGNPEVRQTKGGTNVANLSVATNKKWKSKDGEPKEQTTWHRVSCFGKLADLAAQYLIKGSSVMVIGEIQNESWETESGEKRYATSIRADDIKFLDKKGSKTYDGAIDSGVFHQAATIADEIPF